ncbi:hypothetical protein PC9H_004778 [Pleurotus ostreatus]|uniref:Equilibrative nucleoside transporter 1 n=1 Tax=Pleurotus ostreatus TaxID=5322 RepID=A0A8H7DUX6_PLEOS|nr:uncharacterized protein PC9H_004778 [Pleurotus ostreatus]KAF7432835.1 hypothetical protein PC9H_004778 [Pleurotus ostreatus]KAJ8698603.1 hypothetical protein PTI98_005296 [Pleurotus ostreatus]
MSSFSTEALYHSIPQAPVAANPLAPPADAEIDDVLELQESDILQPPQDPHAEARIGWIHFILGAVILLPWNVMITATPYFLARLSGSHYRGTFSSYLSTSCTASNFVFLAHATITSKKVPSTRIRQSTIWLVVMTLLLTLSTFVTISPGIFFAFVIINGIVQAAAGSYLQTATIQVASLFGPHTVQAMFTGQGAVAVVVSGVQVVSATVSTWGASQETISTYVLGDGSAEERSAFIFFGLSTLFLLFSLAAHAWLVSMPIYKTVAAPLEHKAITGSTTDEIQGLVSGHRHEFHDEKKRIIRVARLNVTYEVAVAYVFIVTLAVFPPITASVQTTNPTTHPLLFSAIHFLMFNIGDFSGRYICSFPRLLIWDSKRLLMLSLARTAFIPLFLMCNVQSSPTSSPTTPIINSDVLFMTILLAFGATNGYLSSLCMMSAPSLEHNPKLQGRREDVDIAATVATFCLVGGLAMGSIASFAVRAAVCNCNPFVS